VKISLLYLFSLLFVLVVLVFLFSLISVIMGKVFSLLAYIRPGPVVVYSNYDDLINETQISMMMCFSN